MASYVGWSPFHGYNPSYSNSSSAADPDTVLRTFYHQLQAEADIQALQKHITELQVSIDILTERFDVFDIPVPDTFSRRADDQLSELRIEVDKLRENCSETLVSIVNDNTSTYRLFIDQPALVDQKLIKLDSSFKSVYERV